MRRRDTDIEFTVGEEVAHAVTHGLGALAALAGAALLVHRALLHGGDSLVVTSVAVYGTSLVLLYAASTIYHALTPPRAKQLFEILDHAFIYVLIAGTYTPFLLLGLGGRWGRTLFAVVWALAAAGVVFKVFFTGRFKLLSTLLYIGMGWLVVVAVKPLLAALPRACLLWLLAGGIWYTGGAAFYLWPRRYSHAAWHVCVLLGSACHYVAVYRYLV